MIFSIAFFAVVAAATTCARAAVVTNVVSEAELMHFINTTNAELKFIGKPINANGPARRAALDTMVVFCTSRIDQVCGGSCSVYNGGPACLNAPGTQCLSATSNVGFCDRGSCGGSCNQSGSCGDRLDNNFCATPGTASILVGA
ncbi:hypothetical protein CPC08DRAFT_792265 [Agrocybe pediades]|nr:hypothetical protein CPC08DRAFT_792265 [Agrocybe pediades]